MFLNNEKLSAHRLDKWSFELKAKWTAIFMSKYLIIFVTSYFKNAILLLWLDETYINTHSKPPPPRKKPQRILTNKATGTLWISFNAHSISDWDCNSDSLLKSMHLIFYYMILNNKK